MGQGVEEGHVGASDSGVRDPGKESRDGEEPGSYRYIYYNRFSPHLRGIEGGSVKSNDGNDQDIVMGRE